MELWSTPCRDERSGAKSHHRERRIDTHSRRPLSRWSTVRLIELESLTQKCVNIFRDIHASQIVTNCYKSTQLVTNGYKLLQIFAIGYPHTSLCHTRSSESSLLLLSAWMRGGSVLATVCSTPTESLVPSGACRSSISCARSTIGYNWLQLVANCYNM
jgi:hypothetical protein